MPSNAKPRETTLLEICAGEPFSLTLSQSNICFYTWLNVKVDYKNSDGEQIKKQAGTSLDREEMISLRDALNVAIAAYNDHYTARRA